MEPLSSPAGQPGQISVKSIHSPLVAGGQEVEENTVVDHRDNTGFFEAT